MRSPFPGMDPYLEQYWGDVHHRLITYTCDTLQRHLPGELVARMDERIFVEPSEGHGRNIIPDVRVVERGRPKERDVATGNGIAVAEPLVVHFEESDPIRQGFIEIIDIKSGRRVVTVIEVLSPSNKIPGPGRDLYAKKQEELRSGGVSLVEIDLLRTGTRVLSVPMERIPEGHRTAYAACVRRGWKPFEIEYYRIPLRDACPRSPFHFAATTATSRSTFSSFWTSATSRAATGTILITERSQSRCFPRRMPDGQTHCSESRDEEDDKE